MSTAEIRPCPFCGNPKPMLKSTEVVQGCRPSYYIHCCEFTDGCGMSTKLCKTEEAAIEAWNKRADEERKDKRLKACPFCGGYAKLLELDSYGDKVYGVFCVSDLHGEYSHGHYVDNYATEEEAIRAWNGENA